MWYLILLGLALEVSAGVCAWRQPVRTYPNTLYWQAILVMMTGAGWVLGAGGALSAGWRWAVAYALAGAVAVAASAAAVVVVAASAAAVGVLAGPTPASAALAADSAADPPGPAAAGATRCVNRA